VSVCLGGDLSAPAPDRLLLTIVHIKLSGKNCDTNVPDVAEAFTIALCSGWVDISASWVIDTPEV